MDQTPDSCSRCEKKLDTSGYPKWCKACRAAYKREYEQLRTQMGEGRGFAAGVMAMRRCAAEQFHEQGWGMFSGIEIRDLLLQMPGPKLPD